MPNRSNPCTEDEMQQNVAEYFSQRTFLSSKAEERYYNRRITPKVYREIRIPNIGRISDIIVFITDKKIVNIECKFADYSGVINQAKDHLFWCDYSYVCFYADTYLPSSEIRRCLDNGIGLLLWQPNIFVEVIQSRVNRKTDKNIRSLVLKTLKHKDCIITGENESKKQLTF